MGGADNGATSPMTALRFAGFATIVCAAPRNGTECKAQGEARVQSEREREIREQIVKLTVEHRELDREISELEQSGSLDQLNITRLKRRKLKLKDQISSLEDQLFPDIIA